MVKLCFVHNCSNGTDPRWPKTTTLGHDRSLVITTDPVNFIFIWGCLSPTLCSGGREESYIEQLASMVVSVLQLPVMLSHMNSPNSEFPPCPPKMH